MLTEAKEILPRMLLGLESDVQTLIVSGISRELFTETVDKRIAILRKAFEQVKEDALHQHCNQEEGIVRH